MDLTEAEDIKKRWQEYTEEPYKKYLQDPDNHDAKGSKNDHFLYQPLADTELIILNFCQGFSVRS